MEPSYPTRKVAEWIVTDTQRLVDARTILEDSGLPPAPYLDSRQVASYIDIAAGRLEDWVCEAAPDMDHGLWYDLQIWAAQQIDWEEVVKDLIPETEGT